MITRRNLADIVGAILAVVALAYFGHTLTSYWSQSAESMLRMDVLLAASVSIGALVVGYLFSAMSWQVICRALGLDIQPRAAARIYFISQFGKYVPGNVGHHVGRLAMGVREGLPGVPLATSQVIEMLMVVATLSTLAVCFGWRFLERWNPWIAYVSPLQAVVIGIGVFAACMLVLRLFRSWNWISTLHELVTTRESLHRLGLATLLIAANGAMAAIAVYVIAAVISGVSELTVFAAGSVFVVSWLAGFVTPGAPAGLGVREAVMLTLLSEALSSSEAVAVTLVFRIATTATDLLVLVLGLLLRPSERGTDGRS